MVNLEDFRAALARLRVMPVIRAPSKAPAHRACIWLTEAGMGGLEITFTTPGAGTVLTRAEAVAAAEAGATFIVSPAASVEVADECARRGLPFLPGAATPSEVLTRWREGAAVVKVFPAREAGGPSFLKALKAVFPDIPLMPTGGISPENAADYLAAGAHCVGMGGELTPPAALESNDPEPVRAAARRALELCGQ